VLKKVKLLLKQAENRKTFFKRIGSFLVPTDPRYIAIQKAYDVAKGEFRQEKRAGGERYFEHLRAVAIILIDCLRVRDYVLIIAALLHDIVEDIPSWTVERVKAEFGDEVAKLVDYLTKPPKGEYEDKERLNIYFSRLRNAPREVFLIKLCDNLHNLLTLWDFNPKRRAKKIRETRQFYLRYAAKHIILIHELEAAVEELEKGKPPGD
jgi:GTP pyrophosphokinase